jgi:hypothetical protein
MKPKIKIYKTKPFKRKMLSCQSERSRKTPKEKRVKTQKVHGETVKGWNSIHIDLSRPRPQPISTIIVRIRIIVRVRISVNPRISPSASLITITQLTQLRPRPRPHPHPYQRSIILRPQIPPNRSTLFIASARPRSDKQVRITTSIFTFTFASGACQVSTDFHSLVVVVVVMVMMMVLVLSRAAHLV